LFNSLFKAATPLLKRGAKALGKQELQTGMEIVGDVVEGKNFKTAAKGRLKSAGSTLANKALHSVGVPGKRINTSSARHKRKKLRREDIFD